MANKILPIASALTLMVACSGGTGGNSGGVAGDANGAGAVGNASVPRGGATSTGSGGAVASARGGEPNITAGAGASVDAGGTMAELGGSAGRLTSSAGGTNATSGVVNTGGAVGKGGTLGSAGSAVTSTGGNAGKGGSPSTGGVITSGGKVGTGGAGTAGKGGTSGSTAKGGTSAGGGVNSGGTTATGGVITTGGNTAAAGSTATGTCSNVRLTSYTDNGETFGCGYHKSDDFLAPFVRAQMTMAMAEPFYGSSYHGSPGESCGECWLITTPTKSGIVMVTDLCPIEGNPLCADPNQLHFDLTEEAAAALNGGSNDMGAARPVACPVTGNIHIEVTDRSWGYFQIVLANYVIPVRNVEVRAANGTTWIPMERVWGAAWSVNNAMFSVEASGPGGVIRVTSAQGEVLTSTIVITAAEQPFDTVDLGIQFSNLAPVSGGVCSM